jgi:gamma-glutamyltranspeptidase/glutathione hydrolase
MSPTLVFDRAAGDRLHLVGGSTLGPMIIHSMAKVLLGTLDWSLGPQVATDLPNFGFAELPVLLERGRIPAATVQALQDRGHRVTETDLATGVQLVQRDPAGGWLGAADPRKEGVAAGD